MEFMHLNGKHVGVPADVIFNYMKYRKASKMREFDWTYEAEEAETMYANNIRLWMDESPKLKGADFLEVIASLEETANKFLEDVKIQNNLRPAYFLEFWQSVFYFFCKKHL